MIRMLLYPLITSRFFLCALYDTIHIYDRLYYYCLSTIDDIIFLSRAIFHDVYVSTMRRVCHYESYDGQYFVVFCGIVKGVFLLLHLHVF